MVSYRSSGFDPEFPHGGLNPCFNGIWSRTIKAVGNSLRQGVLILVLMEYGLVLLFGTNT